jgi:hypothetical protein
LARAHLCRITQVSSALAWRALFVGRQSRERAFASTSAFC